MDECGGGAEGQRGSQLRLRSRTAIVTGAGQGFGLGLARPSW